MSLMYFWNSAQNETTFAMVYGATFSETPPSKATSGGDPQFPDPGSDFRRKTLIFTIFHPSALGAHRETFSNRPGIVSKLIY